MNKIFTRIATAFVGMAMAIGVGVAIGSNGVKQAKATGQPGDTVSFVYTTSSSKKLSTTYGANTLVDDSIAGLSITCTTAKTSGSGSIQNTYNTTYNGQQMTTNSNRNTTVTFTFGDPWSGNHATYGLYTKINSVTFTAIAGTGNQASDQTTVYNVSATIDGEPASSDNSSFNITKTTCTFTPAAGHESGVIVITVSYSTGTKGWFFDSLGINAEVPAGGDPTPSTYSVTYSANGGTGSVPAKVNNLEHGDEYQVEAVPALTKDGYILGNAWNTQPDGNGDDYEEGDILTIDDANVTLYAKWTRDASSTYTENLVNKTITWDLTKESYWESSDSQVTWISNKFNMVADKAGAGTATNNYLPPSKSSSRFYKDGTLTFSVLSSEDILRIEATATTDDYASTFVGSTWTNATAAVSGSNTKLAIVTASAKGNVAVTFTNTVGLSSLTIYYGAFKVLSSITLTKNDAQTKKQYFVGDSASNDGLTVTANYSDSTSADVTEFATITPNPATVTLETTQITYTASYSGKTSSSVTVTGITVSKINPIRAIYDKSNGAAVDVYGYYVGFVKGTGPVIMDGEYGIIIYSKDHVVSGYTEGETILHVTGTVSIYSGLYEISGTPSISVAAGEYDAPDTPVVYSISGGETKYYQSRVSHVSGVPTTSGNLAGTPGDADITLTFTKNAATTTVFFKRAAQTTENMAALKAAVDGEDEITIKCFTGWYNAFQVQFVSIVETIENYTAEDFAQYLLDATDTVCSVWDGHSSNKSALITIWNTLNDEEHFQALPAEEKAAFTGADANYDNDSLDVIENAAGRYNMLVKKYSLSNFASRTDVNDAPVVPVQANVSLNTVSLQSNNTAVIIVVISLASITAVGAFFFLRKRKEER